MLDKSAELMVCKDLVVLKQQGPCVFCQTNWHAPISSAIRMQGGTVISRQHTDKKIQALSN